MQSSYPYVDCKCMDILIELGYYIGHIVFDVIRISNVVAHYLCLKTFQCMSHRDLMIERSYRVNKPLCYVLSLQMRR